MTQTSIVNAVRSAIGGPPICEYPDSSIETCLTMALETYSLYRPLKNISYITTVAGTQAYDLTDVSIFSGYDVDTFSAIEEMFYKSVSSASLIDAAFDMDVVLNNTLNLGINVFSQESLRILEDKEIHNIKNFTPYGYQIFNDTTVYLIPKPVAVQKVYFIYKLKRTVANLKANEFKHIVDFTFVGAARDLGNKRQKLLQTSEPGAGFVMFFGGKHLIKQAEEAEKKIRSELGIKTILTHG